METATIATRLTVSSIADSFHRFQPPNPFAAPPTSSPSDAEEGGRRRGRGRALLLSQSAVDSSALRRDLGQTRERVGLDEYRETEGCSRLLVDLTTTSKPVRLTTGDEVTIVGRPDAIDADLDAIVEHKHRAHRFLNYVPLHERVQCLLYMRMFNKCRARLVERFGNRIRVHEVEDDPALWERVSMAILAKCEQNFCTQERTRNRGADL